MVLTASLTSPIAIEVLEAGVELIPIAAAHVIRDQETNRWRFEAVNRAFRAIDLGAPGADDALFALLGDQLDAFVGADECHRSFDWSVGEPIERRYYRVSLARTAVDDRRRCAVTLLDLTSQIHAEQGLRREMTTDSLTGLPNREGFGDLIEAVVRERAHYAVLVIDIDRFGRLNACLGSLVGDELLITVARRIKGALRARDSLARIGGDEFGVLMAIDDDRAEAASLADRIQRALTAPFRLTDYEVGVECSVGISIGADQDGAGEDLIRHAQFAVKRAKATGRTEVYQRHAFTIAREQFAMETALRRAIEDGQLRLTYQPIRDLATGRLIAFESLARWTDVEGRDHSPEQFIPVAEESGLIVPLGRWAIEEAARTLAAWDAAARDMGPRVGATCGVKLAVNLSPIQLQRDAIARVIEGALASHGLRGDRFTLELTESAIVTDPDGIAATMRALKELGATLALDDFGTGYSNLAYLQRLPIDILKIDRSFVTGMLSDRDKVAIVRAVLSLAQALGKQTTAEGIESHELAQTLAALGCTFGQGYLYARPLEAADAWAMIAAATTPSAIESTRG